MDTSYHCTNQHLTFTEIWCHLQWHSQITRGHSRILYMPFTKRDKIRKTLAITTNTSKANMPCTILRTTISLNHEWSKLFSGFFSIFLYCHFYICVCCLYKYTFNLIRPHKWNICLHIQYKIQFPINSIYKYVCRT